MPGADEETTLVAGPWPEPPPAWSDPEAEGTIDELREAIGAIRNVRSDYRIDPGLRIPLLLGARSDLFEVALSEEEEGLRHLAGLSEIGTTAESEDEPGAHVVLRSGTELFIPLRGLVDLDRERRRLESELARVGELLTGSRRRLEDERFTARAPAEIVERERQKVQSLEERYDRLTQKRAAVAGD